MFQSFQHGVHGRRRQIEELLKLGMRGRDPRVVVLHERMEERQELALLSRRPCGPTSSGADGGARDMPGGSGRFAVTFNLHLSRRTAVAIALRAESICDSTSGGTSVRITSSAGMSSNFVLPRGETALPR